MSIKVENRKIWNICSAEVVLILTFESKMFVWVFGFSIAQNYDKSMRT